ncbi:MAG: DNA-3-methyladenine glycosylase I [Chloroflexi bacterium]|nr:DNA-3-methyladenine glycosylase I [Chloroflexota bacterium]
MAAPSVPPGLSKRRVPLRKPMTPEDLADARVRDALGETGRCEWAQRHDGLRQYHDDVWGERPANDAEFFERMLLEIFHAGLSWTLIWNKHQGIRNAYHGFNVNAVAAYGSADIARLLDDPNVIRSERKIAAAIENARTVQEIQDSHGSFRDFLLDLPTSTNGKINALRKSFKFMGPGTSRAFLESAGLVAPPHHDYCYKARRVVWSAD